MAAFFQVAAGVLLTVILGIVVGKQSKDMTVLITVAACCMVLTVAAIYLQPVMEFVRKLQEVGKLDEDILQILLKAVGIGLIAELANLICADSGNAALGKAIQILATAVVLWLSLPLMNSLIDLVQKSMGEV